MLQVIRIPVSKDPNINVDFRVLWRTVWNIHRAAWSQLKNKVQYSFQPYFQWCRSQRQQFPYTDQNVVTIHNPVACILYRKLTIGPVEHCLFVPVIPSIICWHPLGKHLLCRLEPLDTATGTHVSINILELLISFIHRINITYTDTE